MKTTNNLLILIGVLFLLISSFTVKDQSLDGFIQNAEGGQWGNNTPEIEIDKISNGSTSPDHFGTGTEDYYGCAWGHPELYNHVFISQPIGDANTLKGPGVTVNSRVRILDGIPFSTSLDFQMEKWGWTTRTVHIKWATFWYQK
ncbi:MAG: DUF2961 domain-containing protein [Cytophagales bacterium]|nr:DUF2961 domain-containing protein [Cytophagales bacterium]